MNSETISIEIDHALHISSLCHAKELVQELEAGRLDEAGRLINELCKMREKDLYQDIGKLTRELHETLNTFLDDQRLHTLAEEDMPETRERLDSVIRMTEQSANRTLTSVEQSMPVADGIAARAAQFSDRWQSMLQEHASIKEFRAFAIEIDEFLQALIEDSGRLHGHLSDVMLAQDYQDLTGQVIQRVIKLVREVEDSLVGMIRITSSRMHAEECPIEDSGSVQASGPAVTRKEKNKTLQSQDEVDDLLSSLGF